MNTKIYLATAHGLNVIEGSNGTWRGEVRLQGQRVQCVVVDSSLKERIYCGTFGNGIYRSDDAGASWRPCKGLPNQNVMALATADSGEAGRPALLYAGTEPSAIYQSSDGGDTWHPLPGLLSLTSAGEWSFPPRPETHHVRQILSDPCFPRRLHVAIEAGALLRGEDGGETWRDRVPGGPRDTHTLAAHRSAPGRLYSAAGDGYFESLDDGDTWRRVMEGLEHGYCWSVAVSPSDPDTVLLSASKSPRAAHSKKFANSAVYRRSAHEPWRKAMDGLPDPEGRRVPILARNDIERGVFYLASEGELYRSANSGAEWQKLTVDWAERCSPQHASDIAVVES
jgi:hypothetical protein